MDGDLLVVADRDGDVESALAKAKHGPCLLANAEEIFARAN